MKTNMGTKFVYLSLLLSLIYSRLIIYGPQELKDKFQLKGIIYSLIVIRLQDQCKLRKFRKHPIRIVSSN
jgi:hypothetical protein